MLLRVKSFWVFILVLVVLFAMIIPNWGPKAHALNQSQIVAAMGAGWNLGNQLEANDGNGNPSETAWGNPTITSALITAVKNQGFKTIRIPVSLLKKIGAAPNYTIDAAWMARIKQVVDYAYSQGLYVILDGNHGDGYTTVNSSWLLVNSSDQTTIKAKYKAVWQQYATTFASYDEHLIFESMNEVFDGNYSTPNTTYYTNLNAYNQIFVDTVRQTGGGNNGTRWLLCPGWNTNIDYMTGNYGFVIPTDNYRSSSIPSNEKRIMISAHYYAPWDFVGDSSSSITQWGSISTDSSRKSTWGQEDYMDSQLAATYNSFVTQGYPVVIGEFGTIDKTNMDSTNGTYRTYWAKTLAADCKKYSAVPVVWDNGFNGTSGMALFDRNSYAVTQPGIINGIMSGMNIIINNTPTPTRTATPTPTRTATPTPTLTVTPPPGSNIALNKTASCDSQQSSNPVANGNDGSTSTRWCANDSNTGHWWKVDLGQNYNLTGSEVMWEFSSVYKYKIEVSTDNSTWTLAVDKTGNSTSAQTMDDNFTATARYVRITITGLASGSWASFYEFRVFGSTGSSTPTPTPTPVMTATPTPVRTATPVPGTPTPTPASGSINVQFYNQNTSATTNQLYMNFQLVNTGSSAITLSNVKIRYWYTEDGTQAQSFWCDYSTVGTSNVTSAFVKMGTAKTGADTYVEVGFTSGAGSLAAGASIVIQSRCAKSDWSNYTQTNDYSFNSTGASYADWTKVTGYVSGALQWGTEP